MPDEATPVLDIGEFYELITAHLEAGFGRRYPHWVRGEIAKVFEKGHVYIDLVDAGAKDAKPPMLGTHCWQSSWVKLKSQLASEGVVLRPGMVVNFLGYVDVYAPQGKIGFTIQEVDLEGLLGDVAKRLAELKAKLQREGLFERNKELPTPALPLRIGLIASAGTEGFSDFTGQLDHSGFAFTIDHRQVLVQGEQAPAQIMAALADLAATDVDLIAVVRGGGSKGDLACFDNEELARAIANSPKPVYTGIGHTGDESIADLVAHHRAITPTKLGEEIVGQVTTWYQRHVVRPARLILQAAEDRLAEETAYVSERRRTVVFAVRDRLRSESRHLAAIALRLLTATRHRLGRDEEKLRSTRQLLGAYDPAKRLAQGWSITTTADGRVVRSVDDVALNDTLHVRLVDGTLETNVTGKNGAS